jgi:tryptophan synthase alpha chain
MQRFTQLFSEKSSHILNIYTTAGYPDLNSTEEVVLRLAGAGADIIELGMPYSDPLADGTTIQESSQVALANGMTLDTLFAQAKTIREQSSVPIVLMGYFNQMLQYGEERFLASAQDSGIDALIIPDLPMDIYENDYKAMFESKDIGIAFLVTPETSEERIRQADRLSNAFLYVVSQSKVTGGSSDLSTEQLNYFERLANMNLDTPRLIGFGIHDAATFKRACAYGHGAIIGSAFIRHLGKFGVKEVNGFVESVLTAPIA